MNRAAASFPEWISNWLTLLKRRFVSMEIQADNLVLTKNAEGMTTENVEAQDPNLSAVPKKDYFPVFIVGMSIIQIFSFYIANQSMMLALWLDPYRRFEVWRFITASLVHQHYMELWSIMGFQIVIGVFLEIVHGWKRVSIIYLASVFGGSLFVSLADKYSYSYGASAGVYGLIFSHLASLILSWNEVNRKFTRLFCILFYAMQDMTVTFYYEIQSEGQIDTNHMRHLGGGITGFLVSMLVFNVFRDHRWGDNIRKICIGILATLFVVIGIINATAHYPATEWNFDYQKTYNDHHSSHQLLKQLLENL